VIAELDSQRVSYLSQTSSGKVHDKRLSDEEGYGFPDLSQLFKDTGFQGYEPPSVLTFQPKKKPRGHELTAAERFLNKIISSIRIQVAHVISGIKRCRIVKDVLRNTKALFADTVMAIACGLHNLRTGQRHPPDTFDLIAMAQAMGL
jgi:hypothetical protein